MHETDSPDLQLEDILSEMEDKEFIKFASLGNRSEINPDKIYWGKIYLQNKLPGIEFKEGWNLYFGKEISLIKFWLVSPLGKVLYEKETGTFAVASKKETIKGNRLARIHFSLPDTNQYILFFELKSELKNNPELSLKISRKDFYEEWKYVKTTMRDWFFMGFILTMAVLSFIFFIASRDKAFLFHFYFLMGMQLYLMVDFFAIFPDMLFFREHPYLVVFMGYLFLALMDITYIQFIRAYLDLKQLLPKWDSILRILIWIRILHFLFVSLFFLTLNNEPVTDLLTAAYMIVEYLLICFFLIPLFCTKDKKGYFLGAGTIIVVMGVVFNAATILAGGKLHVDYTIWAVVGEILLFATGFGYRMKILVVEEQEVSKWKEIDELRTRLYTNITHEFRTPLTVIMGMAEELNAYINTPQQSKPKRAIQSIKRSSENLLNLITRMLDLAKLESGQMQLNFVLGDVVAYLKYQVDSIKSYAQSKSVLLHFLTEMDVFEMDYDPEKLQQILSNLLSNAIKFTPENGQIWVLVKKLNSFGIDKFCLVVKDNGTGIEEKKFDKIFDRFYQADEDVIRQGAGTGIGLAYVKELVQL
ncbi:MAG: hypothetical protein GY705_30875, partial [Bacteroidetes bacterium]|nr:hypothetical protein [Bacteroidota bacterium]